MLRDEVAREGLLEEVTFEQQCRAGTRKRVFLVERPGPAGAKAKRGESTLGVLKDQSEGCVHLRHL